MLSYFGVGGLAVAEAMAPDADESVLVFGDKEPALMTELFLCFECSHEEVCLSELKERRNEREAVSDAD